MSKTWKESFGRSTSRQWALFTNKMPQAAIDSIHKAEAQQDIREALQAPREPIQAPQEVRRAE